MAENNFQTLKRNRGRPKQEYGLKELASEVGVSVGRAYNLLQLGAYLKAYPQLHAPEYDRPGLRGHKSPVNIVKEIRRMEAILIKKEPELKEYRESKGGPVWLDEVNRKELFEVALHNLKVKEESIQRCPCCGQRIRSADS